MLLLQMSIKHQANAKFSVEGYIFSMKSLAWAATSAFQMFDKKNKEYGVQKVCTEPIVVKFHF